MKNFTNKNASKSLRWHRMLFVAAFACLLVVGITLYLGMSSVNAIIETNPNMGSDRFFLFIHYQRTESIIISLFMIAFIYTLGLGVIRLGQFYLYVHKHGKDQIERLDREMNANAATWLPKSKTYLTANYIISFRGAFTAVRYSDIFWIYKGEERENGVKTKISLTAFLPDGKQHEVASCTPVPAAEDEFLVIIGTTTEHNPNVLVGYSNENLAAAKELTKRMKLQKK